MIYNTGSRQGSTRLEHRFPRTASYGVSVATAQRAVALLRDRGVVRGRVGIGVFRAGSGPATSQRPRARTRCDRVVGNAVDPGHALVDTPSTASSTTPTRSTQPSRSRPRLSP